MVPEGACKIWKMISGARSGTREAGGTRNPFPIPEFVEAVSISDAADSVSSASGVETDKVLAMIKRFPEHSNHTGAANPSPEMAWMNRRGCGTRGCKN
jgi:hypothetical protein